MLFVLYSHELSFWQSSAISFLEEVTYNWHRDKKNIFVSSDERRLSWRCYCACFDHLQRSLRTEIWPLACAENTRDIFPQNANKSLRLHILTLTLNTVSLFQWKTCWRRYECIETIEKLFGILVKVWKVNTFMLGPLTKLIYGIGMC